MGVMILLPLVMAADIFLWLFVVGMFVPQQASPIVAQLFDVYRQNIIPERDVLYFHAYMLLAAGLFTLLCFQQSRLKTHAKAFKRFLYYEIIITLLSGFMLAKFLLWREAFWLNGFYACVGVSIVSKLCWPELLKLWQRVSEFIDSNQSIPARIGWAAGIIFCIAVIWVRDPLGAAAKIFLGEQFHHMDWFLVPAAWAHLMGNILDIDTISRYGLGAPVWVAHLANILPGHFSYANVIAVLASISVVYFCIWFYNIRSLMGSIGWALLILVWGVRLQMFHTETLPFALTYPQVTPLRCFFDAIVFGLLISFMRRPVAWKLWLASICCGIAIYNIIGEGLYLTGAFGFFILLTQAMAYLQKSKPLGDLSVGKVLLLLVMPLVTFVAIAYAFAGQHVFGREFWSNQIEFIRFYQAGHGSLPLMMNLTQGNFYISIWPFVLPIFYMASLLLVAYRIVQKKSQPMDMIIAALSVYLLLAFHYQATVSNNTTAYLRNAIVMMTISGYWLNDYWRHIALTHVRRWQLAIGMAGIFALATNHMFLIYPNLLNLAKNP